MKKAQAYCRAIEEFETAQKISKETSPFPQVRHTLEQIVDRVD